jgi:hypothetical protein
VSFFLPDMRLTVRTLSLILLGATLVFWFALGGSLGWTKTQVEVKQIDPVTEIEFVTYKDQLVPGIEFLVVGLGGAIALFAVSFIHIPNKN